MLEQENLLNKQIQKLKSHYGSDFSIMDESSLYRVIRGIRDNNQYNSIKGTELQLLKDAGVDFSGRNMGLCDSDVDISDCLVYSLNHGEDYKIFCAGDCVNQASTEL